MDDNTDFRINLMNASSATKMASKKRNLLRLIMSAQPISRTEIIDRLECDRSTITDIVKPLLTDGILQETMLETDGQGRKPRALSFADKDDFLIGVNLGVRTTQVGKITLKGEIFTEEDFATPPNPQDALNVARKKVENLIRQNKNKKLRVVGVSVPGMTDPERKKLLFAPNLGWRDVDIASMFQFENDVRLVVENDATAAAMYEARLKIKKSESGLPNNFILVRSGTGIGVGLVIGNEVYRGSGIGRGITGEFGHMTIVAGGKPCVCGNRGCWEKYASAAAAASLYLGDRSQRPHEPLLRFVEVVSKAENGEIRARRTLEMIGDYLGIGIANVIMGIGIQRVIISGRLVYGWKFIEKSIIEAIRRSIIGKFDGWHIEAGEPKGAAIGGALEVAVEEYLAKDLMV